ncbi:MAG: flippase-like domain-containing protein [Planctomycetia bacterium]|nr:flippase-like domain-containing protein [Planctomycetia bacterium]
MLRVADSASVDEPTRRRSRPAVRVFSTLATLALGAGLVWMAARNLDLEELRAGLRSVRMLPFVFAAVVLMGGPLVLAVEWRIILRGGGEQALGLRTLAPMTIVTLFWQNIAHFMLGYGYALHRFVQREGVRPASALGVVSIDQLAEGIAKAAFSGALVFYFAAPDRAATLLPGLFAGAIVGYLALRPVLRRAVARLALRSERSPTGRKRLVSGPMIERYSRMWNERAVWLCVGLAMFKKMFKVAAAAAVQFALGLDLPPIAPFVFIAVLDCATLVPLIPGHMGVYEATAAATYVRFGAGQESALLVGVLYHAAFLVAAIVPASIVVVYQTARKAAGQIDSPAEAEPELMPEAAVFDLPSAADDEVAAEEMAA